MVIEIPAPLIQEPPGIRSGKHTAHRQPDAIYIYNRAMEIY